MIIKKSDDQYTADELAEAIEKAKEQSAKYQFTNWQVIESGGLFYIERGSSLMIRAFETLHGEFENGKKKGK